MEGSHHTSPHRPEKPKYQPPHLRKSQSETSLPKEIPTSVPRTREPSNHRRPPQRASPPPRPKSPPPPPRKIRYDSDFLLKFKAVCTDNPLELRRTLEAMPDLKPVPMGPPVSRPVVQSGRGRGPREKGGLLPSPQPISKGGRGIGGAGGGRMGAPVKAALVPAKRPANIFKKSEEPEVLREIRGILNKITPEKFMPLSEMLLKAFSRITEPNMYNDAVGLVARKAFGEPNFSAMYADLCQILSKSSQKDKQLSFKRALLTHCQEQFETSAVLAEAGADGGMALSYKKTKLGTVKFVGELFKGKMVPEKVVHICFADIFASIEEHSKKGEVKLVEDYGELLCQLLKTVGASLQDHALLEKYMSIILQLGKDTEKTTPRMRFMLEEILELHANQWIPRQGELAPTKLSKVRVPESPTARRPRRTISLDIVAPTRHQPFSPPMSPGRTPPRTPSPFLVPYSEDPLSSPRGLSTEEAESKIEQILKDFLSSNEVAEAVECVKELNCPQYHHKIVEIGINSTLDKPQKDRDQMFELFCALHQEGGVTEDAFAQGFHSVVDLIDDLEVDIPFAARIVGKFLGLAVQRHCVSVSVVETMTEKVKAPTLEVVGNQQNT